MTVDPPWLAIARGEIGVRETPGPGDTSRIDEYLSTTRLPEAMVHDATPWCAAFVCWCLERSGVPSTKRAAARSYLHWGHAIAEPRLGCIVVFSRAAGGPGSGHVGFYVGSEPARELSPGLRALESIRVLGGNQRDQVCERTYPVSRVLGYRWPTVDG